MKKKFDRIRKMNIRAAFVVVLVSICFTWVAAQGASGFDRTVDLTAGQARTIDLKAPVADILVANPDVAEVGTMRANRLYVVGRSVGDTNVLAFDAAGNQLANIGVHVSVDDTNISEALRKFFPNEDVEAKTVRNDIVLTGKVSTPIIANQVRDLASRFLAAGGASGQRTIVDLMKVQGDQQVMLKVRVIEAKRSLLREYGLEPDFNAAGGMREGLSLNTISSVTGAQALLPFASGSLSLTSPNFGPFQLELSALERDGLVNTLAEPNLTAISGETAGFLAGGEFPVPTGRDTSGNITIEFRQFGVALNFTPTVLASDRISLQLSAEVSAKSTAQGDSLQLVGTTIPGLTTRRAETTVQMGSGGTLMIAGLLKSEDVEAMNGLPGVQNLPIIGELFKSKSFARDETELIFLVTPYLVRPYADQQAVEVSETSPVSAAPPPLPPKHSQAAPLPEVASAPLTDDVVPMLVPVQEPPKLAAAAPSVPVKQATLEKKEPRQVLAHSFVDNLRRIYGQRVPQDIAAKESFGYIVD